MGYSLQWCAARGRAAAQVLEILALRGTGQREDVADSPIVGAALSGGWYLVIAQRETPFSDEQLLARLSTGGEVVTCFVEEHVMYSDAHGWQDGREVWAVVHESEQGLEHLEVRGSPPQTWAAIRQRLEAELSAGATCDHLFDAPVELARALTGYRYDEDPPIDGACPEGGPFEVLAPAPVRHRSWLGRLLSK